MRVEEPTDAVEREADPVELVVVAALAVERVDASVVVRAEERAVVAALDVEREALVRVVLPNVLRAERSTEPAERWILAVRWALAVRCSPPIDLRSPTPLAALRVRILLVLRISRAFVMPALRWANERSGFAEAYSRRDTRRCNS